MPTVRRIKSLKDTNITITQMLKDYIFGKQEIRAYNPDLTYNRGQLAIIYNVDTETLDIMQCMVDGATGPFSLEYWDRNVLTDFLSGVKSSGNPILMTDAQPTDITNNLWLQIIKNKDIAIDPDTMNSGTVVVFSGDQFIGQDDQPLNSEEIKVWFDYEPEG